MSHHFFIAGTDTGVGKTLVTSALLCRARALGLKTIGLKPVAAGAERVGDEWHNDDAIAIQKYATVPLPYKQVNPVCLRDATAPHIAAQRENKRLQADRICAYCRGALLQNNDLALIEGAGGWQVPINQTESMATLASLLAAPVILVVGLRLGCLNHALLTCEAIIRKGLPIAGWVACSLESNWPDEQDYLDSLHAYLPARMLGHIPFLSEPSAEAAAEHVNINALLDLAIS